MKITPKKIIDYLFLLTIISLPLYRVHFNVFYFPTNISEFLAVFSILLFIIYKKNKLTEKIFSRPKWLIISITLLLFGLFSSLFYSGNFSFHGLGIIKGWFIIPIIFSFFASIVFKDELGIKKIFYSLYVSFFIVSIISLFYLMLGISTFDGRLRSFYESPNQLSMFLVFSIFIFHYLYSLEKNVFVKKIILFSFLPILTCLYFTFSYSVWISVFLSITLSLFVFKNSFLTKNKSLVLTISILLVLFFTFQGGTEKASSLFNERSSFSSRIMIWNSSLKILSDNPIFGIGPGNFQKEYLSYQQFFTPYLEWAVPHPHNIYLAFWLQAGFIGFVAFIFLYTKTLVLLIKNKNTALSAMLGMSLFYILIHGLLDTPIWKNDLSYIFWLIIFLSLSLKNQKSNL